MRDVRPAADIVAEMLSLLLTESRRTQVGDGAERAWHLVRMEAPSETGGDDGAELMSGSPSENRMGERERPINERDRPAALIERRGVQRRRAAPSAATPGWAAPPLDHPVGTTTLSQSDGWTSGTFVVGIGSSEKRLAYVAMNDKCSPGTRS